MVDVHEMFMENKEEFSENFGKLLFGSIFSNYTFSFSSHQLLSVSKSPPFDVLNNLSSIFPSLSSSSFKDLIKAPDIIEMFQNELSVLSVLLNHQEFEVNNILSSVRRRNTVSLKFPDVMFSLVLRYCSLRGVNIDIHSNKNEKYGGSCPWF